MRAIVLIESVINDIACLFLNRKTIASTVATAGNKTNRILKPDDGEMELFILNMIRNNQMINKIHASAPQIPPFETVFPFSIFPSQFNNNFRYHYIKPY